MDDRRNWQHDANLPVTTVTNAALVPAPLATLPLWFQGDKSSPFAMFCMQQGNKVRCDQVALLP
jgi:hypothetical protein